MNTETEQDEENKSSSSSGSNSSKSSSSNSLVDEVEETNDSDDENYTMKAKICTRLSRKLQLPELIFDDMGTYDVPKEHGLSNCNVIIPSYYKLDKDPSKIFDVDYFNIIKDDIRNYRTLNEYQMKYIKELPDECKNELFDLFNDCIKIANEFIVDNI